MIDTHCSIPSTINIVARPSMKGQKHKVDKRRKPVLSLGRRMGRKGDPRMHRAVSAKLADPSMTLFHALQAGGFNYMDDIDAKAVDEENVTLAQRKNQLSRRLRMTKNPESDGSTKQGSDDDCDKSCQTFSDLVLAQEASFHSLLRQDTGVASIGSMNSPYIFPDRSHVDTQHGVHHAQQDYGAFPDQLVNNNYGGNTSYTQHESMDSSPGTLQHDTDMGRPLTLPSYENAVTTLMFNDDFVAKEHSPQPPTNILDHTYGEPAHPLSRRASEVSLSASSSNLRTLQCMGSGHVSASGNNNPPLCSEFGLRSLHRTAQSIGLNLDQFALVLSSTENLSTLLGIQNNNNDNNNNEIDQPPGQPT